MKKDFLTILDMTNDDLNEIFKLTEALKRERGSVQNTSLQGKTVGMIFSKSSTRTRVSFEVGVQELGGNVLYLDQQKTQLGRGETVADTARVLSRYLHALVMRTYSHADLVELAQHSTIPVINALTDDYHPCQVITDLFTMYEVCKDLNGVKLAFLGDGINNMANSLILGAKLAGVELVIASPRTHQPNLELANQIEGNGKVSWEEDPVKAVDGADFVYTDVWVSMGDEQEEEERVKLFTPYQLNMELLQKASPNAKVLHCLPAHRGQEITDDVMDCDQAIVFDEAENRLHVQKALMATLI